MIWERHRNFYVLQVEEVRHMIEDQLNVEHRETPRLEETRDLFFKRLEEMLDKHLGAECPD